MCLTKTTICKTPKNPYEIVTHDDTISPYSFEIDPLKLANNINDYVSTAGKKDVNLQNADAIQRLMNFSNFKISIKENVG